MFITIFAVLLCQATSMNYGNPFENGICETDSDCDENWCCTQDGYCDKGFNACGVDYIPPFYYTYTAYNAWDDEDEVQQENDRLLMIQKEKKLCKCKRYVPRY